MLVRHHASMTSAWQWQVSSPSKLQASRPKTSNSTSGNFSWQQRGFQTIAASPRVCSECGEAGDMNGDGNPADTLVRGTSTLTQKLLCMTIENMVEGRLGPHRRSALGTFVGRDPRAKMPVSSSSVLCADGEMELRLRNRRDRNDVVMR